MSTWASLGDHSPANYVCLLSSQNPVQRAPCAPVVPSGHSLHGATTRGRASDLLRLVPQQHVLPIIMPSTEVLLWLSGVLGPLGFLVMSLVAPSQSLSLSPALPLDQVHPRTRFFLHTGSLGGLTWSHGIARGRLNDDPRSESPSPLWAPDSDNPLIGRPLPHGVPKAALHVPPLSPVRVLFPPW